VTPPRLVLASASPRRAELLTRLGIPHEVDPSEVDELPHPGESPGARVARLARAKAEVVAARAPDAWVIGGDTEVVLDGVSLGKPEDAAAALAMLHTLAGRPHVVLSSVALVRPDAAPLVEVVAVRVRMRDATLAELEAYVASGEPLDKAGAYGIQGRGSTLVACIEGDYTAVVGLPVGALLRAFEGAGLRWAFGAGWVPAVDTDVGRGS